MCWHYTIGVRVKDIAMYCVILVLLRDSNRCNKLNCFYVYVYIYFRAVYFLFYVFVENSLKEEEGWQIKRTPSNHSRKSNKTRLLMFRAVFAYMFSICFI